MLQSWKCTEWGIVNVGLRGWGAIEDETQTLHLRGGADRRAVNCKENLSVLDSIDLVAISRISIFTIYLILGIVKWIRILLLSSGWRVELGLLER